MATHSTAAQLLHNPYIIATLIALIIIVGAVVGLLVFEIIETIKNKKGPFHGRH